MKMSLDPMDNLSDSFLFFLFLLKEKKEEEGITSQVSPAVTNDFLFHFTLK